MRKKLLLLIPLLITATLITFFYLESTNEKSLVVIPQTENTQENTQWKTYENEYYTYKYPANLEIQVTTADIYTSSEMRIPNTQGQSYYRNFTTRLYDLSKFPSSYRENPIDVFLYSFQQIDGGSFDSTLENLYIKRQDIIGDFDVEIILNGVWWQGGGPKTASVKVEENYALVVWSQLYDGYYNENGEFILNETDFSETTKKILQEFKSKL